MRNLKLLQTLKGDFPLTATALIEGMVEWDGHTYALARAVAHAQLALDGVRAWVEIEGGAVVLREGGAVARIEGAQAAVREWGCEEECTLAAYASRESVRREVTAWRTARNKRWRREIARAERGPDQSRSRAERQRSRERALARRLKSA